MAKVGLTRFCFWVVSRKNELGTLLCVCGFWFFFKYLMSLCTTCLGVHPVRLLFSVESHHIWKAGWSLTKHFSAAVRLTGWVKPQRSELKKHWAQESGDFLFFLLSTNPMNKLLYGAPLLLKISVTCSFFYCQSAATNYSLQNTKWVLIRCWK